MWREKGIKTAAVTSESHRKLPTIKLSSKIKERDKTSASRLDLPSQDELKLDSCGSCSEPSSPPQETQIPKKASKKADESCCSFNAHALTVKRNRARSFLSRPKSVRPPRNDGTGDGLYRSLPRRIQLPLELSSNHLPTLPTIPLSLADTGKRKLKLENKLDLESRVSTRPSVWFPSDTLSSMRTHANYTKHDDDITTLRTSNFRTSAALDTTTYSCSKEKEIPHMFNSSMTTLKEQTVSSNSSQNRHSEGDFVGRDTKQDEVVAENKPWVCYSFKDFATLPTEVLEIMTCSDQSSCTHDHSRYRVVGDKIYIRHPDASKYQKKPIKTLRPWTSKRQESIQSSKKTQCASISTCDTQVASTQIPSHPCIVEHRDISTEISNINIGTDFTNTATQVCKLSELLLEKPKEHFSTSTGINAYGTSTFTKSLWSKRAIIQKSIDTSKTTVVKSTNRHECNTNEQCSNVILPEDPKKDPSFNRCVAEKTETSLAKSTSPVEKNSHDSQITAPPTGYHIRDDTSPSEAISTSCKCSKNLTIKIPMSAQRNIKIMGDLKEESECQNNKKILEIDNKKDEIIFTATKDSKHKTSEKVKKQVKKETSGKKNKKPKVMIIGKLNYNVSKNADPDNEKCLEKSVQHQAIKMTQMIKNTKFSFDLAKHKQSIASTEKVCHLLKKHTSMISNKKESIQQESPTNYFPLKQNTIYQYYHSQSPDINSKNIKSKSKSLKLSKQSCTRKKKPMSIKKSGWFDDKLNTNDNAGTTPEPRTGNVMGQGDPENNIVDMSNTSPYKEKEQFPEFIDFCISPSSKETTDSEISKYNTCHEDFNCVNSKQSDNQADDTICFSITSSIKNILEILEENPKHPTTASHTGTKHNSKEKMTKMQIPCDNNRNSKQVTSNGHSDDFLNNFMTDGNPVLEHQINTQNVSYEINPCLSGSNERSDVFSSVLSEPPKNDEVELTKSVPGESGDCKGVYEANVNSDGEHSNDTDRGLLTEEIASKASNPNDKEDITISKKSKCTTETKRTNINVGRNLTFIKSERVECVSFLKKENNQCNIEDIVESVGSLPTNDYNFEPIGTSENNEQFRCKDKEYTDVTSENKYEIKYITEAENGKEVKVDKKCDEKRHLMKDITENNFVPFYTNPDTETNEETVPNGESDLSKKEKQLKSKARKRKRKPKKKFTSSDDTVESKETNLSPPFESIETIGEMKKQKNNSKKIFSSKLSQNFVNIKEIIDRKNLETAAIINQCTQTQAGLNADDIGDKIRSMVEQKVKSLIDTYNIKNEEDESYIRNLNQLKTKILQKSDAIDTKKPNKISETIRDRSESFLSALKNRPCDSPTNQQSPPIKPRSKSLLPISLRHHAPRFQSLQPKSFPSDTSSKKESLHNQLPRVKSLQNQLPQDTKQQSPHNKSPRNVSPRNQSPKNVSPTNPSPRDQSPKDQSSQPATNQGQTKAKSLLSQNPRWRTQRMQSPEKLNTEQSKQPNTVQSTPPIVQYLGQQSKTASPKEHFLNQTAQGISTTLRNTSPQSGHTRSKIMRMNSSLGCKSEKPKLTDIGHKSQSQESVDVRCYSVSPQRQTAGFARSFRSASPRHNKILFKSQKLPSQKSPRQRSSLYGSISPVTNSPFLKRQKNKTLGSSSPSQCLDALNPLHIEASVAKSGLSSGMSVNSSVTLTNESSISESTSYTSRSLSSSEKDYSCIPTLPLPEPPDKSNPANQPTRHPTNSASLTNHTQILSPKPVSTQQQVSAPIYPEPQKETSKENQQSIPFNHSIRLGRSRSRQTLPMKTQQSIPVAPPIPLWLSPKDKQCLPTSSLPIETQHQEVTKYTSSESTIDESTMHEYSDDKLQVHPCLPEPEPKTAQQYQSTTSNDGSETTELPNAHISVPPNSPSSMAKPQLVHAADSPKCPRITGPVPRQIKSLQNRLLPSRQKSPSVKYQLVKHSSPISKCLLVKDKVSISNTSITSGLIRPPPTSLTCKSYQSKSSACLSPINETQSQNSQLSQILNVSPNISDMVLTPKEQDSVICDSQMSSDNSFSRATDFDSPLPDSIYAETAIKLLHLNTPASQHEQYPSPKASSPRNKSYLPLSKSRKNHAFKLIRRSPKPTSSFPVQESKEAELPKAAGDKENDLKAMLPLPDSEANLDIESNKTPAKLQTPLKEKKPTQPRKLAWSTKSNQETEKSKLSKDKPPASKKKKRYFIVKAEKPPTPADKEPPLKTDEKVDCKGPAAQITSKISSEPQQSKDFRSKEKPLHIDKENNIGETKTVQFAENVETCEPIPPKKKRYRELKKNNNKCVVPRPIPNDVRAKEVNTEEQKSTGQAGIISLSPLKTKKKAISWDNNLPETDEEKDDVVLEGWKTGKEYIEDEYFDVIKDEKPCIIPDTPQIEYESPPKEKIEKKTPKPKKKKKDSKKVAYNKKIKTNYKSRALDFITKERIRMKGSPVDIKQIIEGSSVDGPSYTEMYHKDKEDTLSGQHVLVQTSCSGNEKLIKCVSKFPRSVSPEDMKTELSQAFKTINKKGKMRIESSVDPAPRSRSRSRSPRTKKVRPPSNKKFKSPPNEYDVYDMEEKHQVQESMSLKDQQAPVKECNLPLVEYSSSVRDYNTPLKEYPLKEHFPKQKSDSFSKPKVSSSPLPLEKPWSAQVDPQKGQKKKSQMDKTPDNLIYSKSVPHWNRPKIKWERKPSSRAPVFTPGTNRKIMLHSPAPSKQNTHNGLSWALNSVANCLSVSVD